MTHHDHIRRRAGEFTDSPARLGAPVEVADSDGRPVAWMVPVVDGDRLSGFVMLGTDLTHLRTSQFSPRPGEGLPSASSWLDGEEIAGKVRPRLGPGEHVGEPWLSFDGSPERIAWAVPIFGLEGRRLAYVAGDSVWDASPATGLG